MIKSLTDIASVRAYLNRIGAEARSLRTAVVKEQAGKYWKDVAVIRINPDGNVDAPANYKPTSSEAALIMSECLAAEWPTHKRVSALQNLPPQLKKASADSLFTFYDEAGLIVMLQSRIEDPKGGKTYVPWTYWSDGEWRPMEPEGALPLWGIEQFKDNSTVFIHEGAKAARHIRWMIEAKTPEAKEALRQHPWGEELSSAAHVGWVGGALSPSRTDWASIKRAGLKRAYIVSDNDAPGVAAVSAIAFRLRVPTFHLQFTSEWPVSFDLADPFPKKMFSKIGKSSHYIGPSFRSCLHPATWATDQIQVEGDSGRSKTVTLLRDEFRDMWTYVEEADIFVCNEMPEIMRTEAIMNKIVAGFSHTQETCKLLVKSYKGRSTKLCYRPDLRGRVITDKTTSAINLHQPTTVKPVAGDIKPWEEFLEYLFQVPKERHEIKRWVATLVACPEIRMEYGLLLVSETQGIGKTTLASKICAPLVGDNNVGFPTEDDIVNSNFNGWLANKRLVIIGEIYSGHSWKAYNKLKGYITDKDVEVNQKYQRPYRVENWAHIIASSNSRKALKMEETDRRWFYPSVTEKAWPKAKFGEFNEWLSSGGLQVIYHWAKNFGDYVDVGQRAPSTLLKSDLIRESMSEAAQEFVDFLEAVDPEEDKLFITTKSIVAWLKNKVGERVYEREQDLRKIAVRLGWWVWPERIKVGAQNQYVLCSPATNRTIVDWDAMTPDEKRKSNADVRKLLTTIEQTGKTDL